MDRETIIILIVGVAVVALLAIAMICLPTTRRVELLSVDSPGDPMARAINWAVQFRSWATAHRSNSGLRPCAAEPTMRRVCRCARPCRRGRLWLWRLQ